MESYLGTVCPLFMIRRGPWKLIWAATDPTMLFNIDEDPLELKNLAKDPAHADIMAAFEQEVQQRWDVSKITSEVLSSQVRRRLVGNALKLGRKVCLVCFLSHALLTVDLLPRPCGTTSQCLKPQKNISATTMH